MGGPGQWLTLMETLLLTLGGAAAAGLWTAAPGHRPVQGLIQLRLVVDLPILAAVASLVHVRYLRMMRRTLPLSYDVVDAAGQVLVQAAATRVAEAALAQAPVHHRPSGALHRPLMGRSLWAKAAAPLKWS